MRTAIGRKNLPHLSFASKMMKFLLLLSFLTGAHAAFRKNAFKSAVRPPRKSSTRQLQETEAPDICQFEMMVNGNCSLTEFCEDGFLFDTCTGNATEGFVFVQDYGVLCYDTIFGGLERGEFYNQVTGYCDHEQSYYSVDDQGVIMSVTHELEIVEPATRVGAFNYTLAMMPCEFSLFSVEVGDTSYCEVEACSDSAHVNGVACNEECEYCGDSSLSAFTIDCANIDPLLEHTSCDEEQITVTDLLRYFEGVNTGNVPPLPCSLDDYFAGTCSLEEMCDAIREQNGEGIACFLLPSGEMDIGSTFNVCRDDTTLARQDYGFEPPEDLTTLNDDAYCFTLQQFSHFDTQGNFKGGSEKYTVVYPPHRAGTHSWNAMPATCGEVDTFLVLASNTKEYCLPEYECADIQVNDQPCKGTCTPCGEASIDEGPKHVAVSDCSNFDESLVESCDLSDSTQMIDLLIPYFESLNRNNTAEEQPEDPPVEAPMEPPMATPVAQSSAGTLWSSTNNVLSLVVA